MHIQWNLPAQATVSCSWFSAPPMACVWLHPLTASFWRVAESAIQVVLYGNLLVLSMFSMSAGTSEGVIKSRTRSDRRGAEVTTAGWFALMGLMALHEVRPEAQHVLCDGSPC